MDCRRHAFWLITSWLLLAGCPHYGMVDDGTSISYGPSNQGKLVNPTRLPDRGEGYRTPARWATRGLRYGTDELVDLIIHAGRQMRADSPDAMLGVADLSPRRGGPSAWHRSHQTGRDADLLFFAVDANGAPVELDTMLSFDADGSAVLAPGMPQERVIHFDVARNWLLVRALIDNPVAPVQFLFIADPLKQKLIDHARAMGEPDALIQRASFLLHQPSDSLPHDDHLHLRIFCAPSDRSAGCLDRGVLRWLKKDYKYDPVARLGAVVAANAVGTPMPASMPAMLALGVFPFRP